jgi:UDPglucose--hexose-1-phosphate uridylyltransferase
VSAERRLNLLTGDWILVSPHRLSRPWQGATNATTPAAGPSFDAACYLCPGNERAGGNRNPPYDGVYVFDNDYPALLDDTVEGESSDSVLVAEPERGICRVVCYTPDHSRTMAGMSREEIRAVVDVWAAQFCEMAARPDIGAVTIFENRGEMMGASNPHPHGQIWATESVPNELAREDARQLAWAAEHGEPLLSSYLARELASGERVVCENETFVALVPWWAAWPFEVMILPRWPVSGLDGLTNQEFDGLADMLHRVTRAYDRLFGVPFPYSMGLHQRPCRLTDESHFTMHVHFYPPLLRSAAVRKFMVGFEMLAMPQRDLTPEDAAARLKAVV